MLISPPLSNVGFLVTIFKIPPGATFPNKRAALPLSNSTRSNEETSGIEPLVKRKPFLNILFDDISYPLDQKVS